MQIHFRCCVVTREKILGNFLQLPSPKLIAFPGKTKAAFPRLLVLSGTGAVGWFPINGSFGLLKCVLIGCECTHSPVLTTRLRCCIGRTGLFLARGVGLGVRLRAWLHHSGASPCLWKDSLEEIPFLYSLPGSNEKPQRRACARGHLHTQMSLRETVAFLYWNWGAGPPLE